MTTTPDPVRDALSSLREATPPPATYTAVSAASRSSARQAPARRRGRATRTLTVVAGLLAAAGTATAAVTASGPFAALETSATTDAPAARNLGVLLASLDHLPVNARSAGSARSGQRAGGSALAGDGPTRGTTVTRDGISVDVALNDTRICLGTAGPRKQPARSADADERRDTERARPPITDVPRATDPAGLACFARSSANRTLPSISGRDAGRVWLTAVVPDGVVDLTVTADGGRTATPTVNGNVAIASLPGARRLLTLTWTASDGTRTTQDLSVTPGARPTVRRLGVG